MCWKKLTFFFDSTWKMLAQCLVRKKLFFDFQILLAHISRNVTSSAGRELFPTSDCLKASQRDDMLLEEITRSGSDIICLQVSLQFTAYIYNRFGLTRTLLTGSGSTTKGRPGA